VEYIELKVVKVKLNRVIKGKK